MRHKESENQAQEYFSSIICAWFSEDKCRKSAPPERSFSLADKSYVCKELMQAGAGSGEGTAESTLSNNIWFFGRKEQ